MSAYVKKLLLAALMSTAGIAASYTWYVMTAADKGAANSRVLAHLELAKNEVQKRSVKRVIWQAIEEGEDLHSGEAVRTAYDAEAKIVFNSGAEVDLDPDSVIVIEDTGSKVNLDFVKGNLLVKGTNQSNDLDLKSGNTSIAVSNSDLSLGKGAGQNVDLQVLRGVAEVNTGDKKLTLDESNHGTISKDGVDVAQKFFKSPQPAIDEKVFLRAGDPLQFKWSGVAANYEVHLEVGATRDSLKATGAPAVPGTKDLLKWTAKPGTMYWRLVATNPKDPKDTHSSLPSKAVVVVDIPPKLLAPTPDQTVTLTSQTQTTDLRWANPSHLSKLQLEVAHDTNFKDVVVNKFVDDTGVFTITEKQPGNYFWRVAGYRGQEANPLVSQPQKFVIKTNYELTPPELKFPSPQAHVPFESVNSGSSFFVWKEVPGIGHYHVKVEAENVAPDKAVVFDKDILELTQVKMPALTPGHYKWYVTSINDDGKESKTSQAVAFVVDQVPQLAWAHAEQQESYYYVTPKPTLKPDWKNDSKVKYARYHITVKSDNAPEITMNSTSGAPQIDLPNDGLYHVVVEGVDAKGQTVARSDSKDFFVSPQPLLPAPNFSDRLPASLQAQNNGDISISWKGVVGAKSYKIQVKDGAGKIIKTEEFNGASGTVKDLLPGSYKVSLLTVDKYGRSGPLGAEKELMVPDVSDAKPPALKKIQIK